MNVGGTSFTLLVIVRHIPYEHQEVFSCVTLGYSDIDDVQLSEDNIIIQCHLDNANRLIDPTQYPVGDDTRLVAEINKKIGKKVLPTASKN